MSEYNNNFDAWLADQDAWVQGLAQSNTINEAMRRAYYAGKARYVALEAALRGAALADAIALPRRNYQDMHDARVDAIGDYRARLLAKIDEAKETT